MGEVYRARDLRLGRDVAVKVLASHIAGDRDAITRFEREARALAALNHPHIAAIYDVQEHAGQPMLVLELVDGESLADRIAAKSVSIDQALDYARQICEALDVAHEAGIVHRDLKPANITVTDAGQIKILDFGLAKAVAAAAGQDPEFDPASTPTITVHGTRHGVILGTAAYMSPEQARGKRIDKRTDIWAFGCVLFEMLTGTRAFNGETTSDMIAAILERAPDLGMLPRSTPPHVRRVVERCLEKDPKRRARDIADVRAELATPTTAEGESRGSPIAVRSALAIITLAAIVLAGTAWRWRPMAAPPPAPVEFTFGAPPGYTLVSGPAPVSSDGRRIAFLARDDKQASLFVRSLDTGTSRRIEGTEGVGLGPRWSADGRSIAFFVSGVWKRIGIDGGPPITIVSNVQSNLGGSWGADDTFLMSPGNRTALVKVPIAGGTPQPVTTLNTDTENSHRWPQLLPDGRHFLFTVRSDAPDRLGIKLGSLDSGDARALVKVASEGVYAEPGWLLFVTPDQVLMAQRLAPATWTLQGNPQPVAGPVQYVGGSFRGFFEASLDGRVVTYNGAARAASTLEWFDRAGKSLGHIGTERNYQSVRLAHDGRTVAVELPDAQVGTRDVWLIDTAMESATRFTTNPATDWRGVLSPDAKIMAFASDRAGASAIYTAPIANSGEQTQLLRVPSLGVFPTDWAADGKYVFGAVDDDGKGGPRRLVKIPLAGGEPEQLLAEPQTSLIMPRVSPDGNRVAYSVRDSSLSISASSTADVYVSSIRDHTRVRISNGGGALPVWGPDGKELFYLTAAGELMRAELAGVGLTGPPKMLFKPCETVGRIAMTELTMWTYDISPDGTRFLAICSSPESSAPSAINVIVNWQSKLK
jgi:Tol biopolymer transport system component